jgi:hypothetical protein
MEWCFPRQGLMSIEKLQKQVSFGLKYSVLDYLKLALKPQLLLLQPG